MFDSPLTEEGKLQASRVTGHYDVVLCSPLKRTRETLENSKITYNKLVGRSLQCTPEPPPPYLES